MIGRVWTWDAQLGGAYYLDDDGATLLHVPALEAGGFEWGNPAEVDFFRIDEDIAAEGERARERLQHWGHLNRDRIRGGRLMFRRDS